MLNDIREMFAEYVGLITICFLLIFFSIFGQSVFFGIYLPMIQAELNMSKTDIGLLYAIATIASSIAIIFTGKGLDKYPLRNFVSFVLIGVAIGCFVMAKANSAITLLIAFFLLRQFGQGLMVLSASSSINRYLHKNRGKAVAITSLGGSFQLMAFPLLALTIDQYINWRDAWIYYGCFLLFVLMPAFWLCLKNHQLKTHIKWQDRLEKEDADTEKTSQNNWNRKQVLKDYRFYFIIAIATIAPFTGTAFFFYQRELASSLSLTPIEFAGSFSIFTISSIIVSLISGAIIDKYGEKIALLIYPMTYTIGLYLLTTPSTIFITYSGMLVLGASTGIMATIGGPILAKLYGTKNLAGIKSLLFSSNILASALSPFIFGLLIDQGYNILTIFSWVIYYTGFVWVLAFPICSNAKQLEAKI